ncbi:hypothetical protein CROQUDRAFT_98592 [Cronartium quercuum f. sp. fusiforme G11]|uniref:Uncharacterized protein n=1 Tax=Cronartium quercuum f. sp. fusiforme G11 TaxID=708437 RepID=A0A9P6T7K1_9BASI|nr:hypothetical protein CROQUDRAFT_98592 [Cronartium quercuum f. sp. fusiforme G11]
MSTFKDPSSINPGSESLDPKDLLAISPPYSGDMDSVNSMSTACIVQTLTNTPPHDFSHSALFDYNIWKQHLINHLTAREIGQYVLELPITLDENDTEAC